MISDNDGVEDLVLRSAKVEEELQVLWELFWEMEEEIDLLKIQAECYIFSRNNGLASSFFSLMTKSSLINRFEANFAEMGLSHKIGKPLKDEIDARLGDLEKSKNEIKDIDGKIITLFEINLKLQYHLSDGLNYLKKDIEFVMSQEWEERE